MHRIHRLLWPLLAVLIAVLSTAPPAAADYRDVYKQCESGTLTSRFSARDLQLASQRMSSYLRDYTNCSDAIFQAQTSSQRARDNANPGTGGGSSNGSGISAGGGIAGSGGSSGGGGSSTGSSQPPADGAPSPTLSADDQFTARTAAEQAADANGTLEQAFAAARVPADALALSSTSRALPATLVVALTAAALLAVGAAAFSGLARVRRSRVD